MSMRRFKVSVLVLAGALGASAVCGADGSIPGRQLPHPVPIPTSIPVPVCPIDEVAYIVRAGSVAGDGSVQKPFGSIADALRMAALRRACRVKVAVDRGTYPEPLDISRPTVLIGASPTEAAPSPRITGRVLNRGGFALTVKSFSLEGVTGIALEQAGGPLSLQYVVIRGTHAIQGDWKSGTGLFLTNGTQASLSRVSLEGNAHRAIWASDAGTVVRAGDLRVVSNQVDPDEAARDGLAPNVGIAAIEIAESARFLALRLTADQNSAIGVQVRAQAQAFLHSSTIGHTRSVIAQGVTTGGVNLMVSDGAVAELNDFILEGAPLAGVFVKDAYLTAEYGEIRDNLVGIVMDAQYEPGYEFGNCIPNATVHWSRNQRSFSGSPVPVYDPVCSGPSPTPSCMQACRRVNQE